MRKLTTEEFIQKAIEVHGGTYNYSESKYVGSNKKLQVICKNHGAFMIRPDDHYKGVGCSTCGTARMAGSCRHAVATFITQATEIHGETYKYSEVVYVNTSTPVSITCTTHAAFLQRPKDHLRGQGCPRCKAVNIRKAVHNVPTSLYYIRFTTEHGTLYKIGVTRTSIGVTKRFYGAPDYTVLKVWDFSTGKGAYQMEQLIISCHTTSTYSGPKVLRTGNTELFTEDILELDT